LTGAGISEAIAACDAAMQKAAGGAELEGRFVEPCASSLREEHGAASYSVEVGGLRLHPILGTAAPFVLELEGALVPWSAVDGGLTTAGVAVRSAST
jgi:hypothetical protein